MKNYTIILFYKYVLLKNPKRIKRSQSKVLKELDIKGRKIIADKGINATLEGLNKDINKYIRYMKAVEEFKRVQFKKSKGDGTCFPNLDIKVRDEIVSSYIDKSDLNPKKVTGKYIYPDKLHKLYKENKDFKIIDMRNDYEYKIGFFKDALNPKFKNFRDLPKITKQLEKVDKNTKIVTYCTGGIRCEKASGFLVKQGFKNVYQLYGGIHKYIEKYPDGNFLGKMYVFDKRVVTDGFKNNEERKQKVTVVGICELCEGKTENYVNCALKKCNRHMLMCQKCLDKETKLPYCTTKCKTTHKKTLKNES